MRKGKKTALLCGGLALLVLGVAADAWAHPACDIEADKYVDRPKQATMALQKAVDTCEVVTVVGDLHLASWVEVKKPVTIQGAGTVPNDGSQVPLSFASSVPATRISTPLDPTDPEGPWYGAFAIFSSGVTIQNLWIGGNSAITAHNPAFISSDPITIRDNVIDVRFLGISLWNSTVGLDILDNYVAVDTSPDCLATEDCTDSEVYGWRANCPDSDPYRCGDGFSVGILIWEYARDPSQDCLCEGEVNILDNYFDTQWVDWVFELGGPYYLHENALVAGNAFDMHDTPGHMNINRVGVGGEGGQEVLFMANTISNAKGHPDPEWFKAVYPDGWYYPPIPFAPLELIGSKNITVAFNRFVNIDLDFEDFDEEEEAKAAVYVRGHPSGALSTDNLLFMNDFTASGLPGRTTLANGDTEGAACVRLWEWSWSDAWEPPGSPPIGPVEDNVVIQPAFLLPTGNPNICEQVVDDTEAKNNDLGWNYAQCE